MQYLKVNYNKFELFKVKNLSRNYCCKMSSLCFYSIFPSLFSQFKCYLEIYQAKYEYLKNNNLISWSNSVKTIIIRGKVQLEKKNCNAICELKLRILKSRKSIKFLEKLVKLISNEPFYKKVVKKIKKKRQNLQMYKQYLLLMRSYQVEISSL